MPVPLVLPGWTAESRLGDAPYLTFVQVARGLASSGSSLDLLDLAPVTVCVAPGPASSLSHVTTGAFLDLWVAADERVTDQRGRRGVLSVVDPESRPIYDTVLRLHRPRIHGSGLQYDVEVVDGILPTSSGSCVLFVQPVLLQPATRFG